MITALKSRKKLLLHKHYFILAKHFFFDNLIATTRGKKSDIRQENTKNPEIKFTFLPLSTVFPSLKQKLNTNQI